MEIKSKVPQRGKAASNTTRLIKAFGTMVAIWAIWKFPAGFAEKHLKNIHI